MIRHPGNPNLTLHYDSLYQGLPVFLGRGPLIVEYLKKLRLTIDRAFNEYSRIFAFRVDLHFPVNLFLAKCVYTNQSISDFFESFRSKIEHNRDMAIKALVRAHDSTVRYVWAREVGSQDGRPHYHLVILLNYDAFNTLGTFEPGRSNMFNRLQEAWASALGVPVEAARGLVHVPENPMYCLRKGDVQGLGMFFYRASYLCKSATKIYVDGKHAVDCSRC